MALEVCVRVWYTYTRDLTSMKLALIYSDPSSPVGLSLARDMLSVTENFSHQRERKRERETNKEGGQHSGSWSG